MALRKAPAPNAGWTPAREREAAHQWSRIQQAVAEMLARKAMPTSTCGQSAGVVGARLVAGRWSSPTAGVQLRIDQAGQRFGVPSVSRAA